MRGNKIDKAEGNLPRHIAIIMDGNGRWAKKRLMPRSFGHRKGVDRMLELLEHAFDRGVEFVTVYALSTENLKRPQAELDALFSLMREHFVSGMKRICDKGVRLKVIGDRSLLPRDVVELVEQAEKNSETYEGKGVNVALAYGARAEIVRAVNACVTAGKEVTEEDFSSCLYTGGQPEVDLIIRTGKEKRLSNFLLYQAAYAELYFSDKMFPEFSNSDLDTAMEDFASRKRRYGKTDEQCEGENK